MLPKTILHLGAAALFCLLAACSGNKPEEDPVIAPPRFLLMGGDISELSYVEQNGGKYYYQDGKEGDCLRILQDAGFNFARLRLYNDPGNPDYSPSKRLPAGIQDEADVLALAKRAKAAGMKLELTFHYSDYWTNGGNQTRPHEWEGLDYAALKQAVYDYTYQFMKDMAAQGTTPEYVSPGNEIQGGILFPDGKYDKPAQMCELLAAGAKAVRDAAPSAKIVIHLDDGGNLDKYTWFFGLLDQYGVPYDVIGTSYYPFWTKKNVAEFMSFANKLLEIYPNKEMIVMETGYAWNPTLPSGKSGQLSNNGPYPSMTKEGQKAFMQELVDGLRAHPRILGFLYWDPVFIEVPGLGWELGASNVVSTTTLFDFQGKALPVLDVLKQ